MNQDRTGEPMAIDVDAYATLEELLPEPDAQPAYRYEVPIVRRESETVRYRNRVSWCPGPIGPKLRKCVRTSLGAASAQDHGADTEGLSRVSEDEAEDAEGHRFVVKTATTRPSATGLCEACRQVEARNRERRSEEADELRSKGSPNRSGYTR